MTFEGADRKVDWSVILIRIDSHLRSARCWAKTEDYSVALREKSMAISLIELLEINLCGSTGGFAKGQSDRTLNGRVKWLKKNMTF